MSNAPFYPVGVYVGEVTSQALAKAGTGTNQFVLRFKVLGTPTEDGSYAPESQQYERTIYMAITDKTISFVAEALEKLGYANSSFGPLDPQHPRHQSFKGNQIDVYCKHETDRAGQLRERWQLSRGSGGINAVPLDPKDVRELDALFGKALKPKAKDAAVAKVPVANDGTEITDDDIPF